MKKIKFNYEPKTQAFSHQVEAIDYITKNSAIALFDEQGLGKSKIVIDALCNNLCDKSIDGALIICKKQLISNWIEEVETHSYLKYIALGGSPNEKGLRFMGFAHLYIINYESVINEVTRLKLFMKTKRMAIVLDESHKIKTPTAKVTQAIFELKGLAYKKIIISGTPLANKPADLWSQYYFLDDGKVLGDNFTNFKNKYTVNLKEGTPQDFENFKELREIIKANSIRRKKDDVLELPEKIYIDKLVELKGGQLALYEQIKYDLAIEIQNTIGELIIDESSGILKRLLRLAQIASNPVIIDKSYQEIPAKIPILDELIQEIVDKEEKVIIWSSFVENIRILHKRYRAYGSLMLFGEIPINKRNDIVQLFKHNPNYKILIANPAAAREGLTLTSANNAIYYDRNFNLVDYLQSQDRIHRISQKKDCYIYKLIAKDTIDEYIDEILSKKTVLADFVQGDEILGRGSPVITKVKILNMLGVHNGGEK